MKLEVQRHGFFKSWLKNEILFLIATTQDNLDDKLRKFEIRDMMGLTDDRDISETVSETWSTDVLGSDFDPNVDEDRLQEIAGNCYLTSLEDCCLVFPTHLPFMGGNFGALRNMVYMLAVTGKLRWLWQGICVFLFFFS